MKEFVNTATLTGTYKGEIITVISNPCVIVVKQLPCCECISGTVECLCCNCCWDLKLIDITRNRVVKCWHGRSSVRFSIPVENKEFYKFVLEGPELCKFISDEDRGL